MSDNVIKIWFQTLFNRSGADEAKKAIRETAVEVRAAETSAAKASIAFADVFDSQKGGRSNKTAQLIGDVRQTMTGLASGAEGVVSSMQGMIKLFPSMAAFAGPVGIVAAGFGALASGIMKVHEWLIKQETALAQSKLENLNGKLDRITSAYARLREEMEDGIATRKAYDSTATEATQANRRTEDAQMELAYRQQMAVLGEDETAKSQLTADYNIAKADLALTREREDAQNKLNTQIDEETTANERLNLLISERTEKTRLLNEALKQQVYSADKAKTAFLDSTMKAYTDESKAAGDIVTKLLGDIRTNDRDIKGTQQAANVARDRSMLFGAETARAVATQGVSELDYTATNKTIQTARDKEALAALDRLNEAATGMGPEFVRALQKVVDTLNSQKRFTAAEIDRLTRDVAVQRQRQIGY